MKMDSLTSVEVRTKSGILAYSALIFVSSYQSGQIQDREVSYLDNIVDRLVKLTETCPRPLVAETVIEMHCGRYVALRE